MNLTLQNGITLTVDKDKIESFGPHIDGGLSIKVNGNTYHVQETIDEFFKLNK